MFCWLIKRPPEGGLYWLQTNGVAAKSWLAMKRATRYLLPGSIVVLCLAPAAMGALRAVAFVASLGKAEALPMPLTILLYTCSLIIGLSHGQLLVGMAGALWVWLAVAGDRISVKVWTAAIILVAIYGLQLFNSEFRVR